MKKLFFLSLISGGILSWLFFLFLTVFTFYPWTLIKTIDQYFFPSYSIDFSELESTGKILNRNLKFFNLNIFHNDKTLFKVKELDIGLSLKPQKFFYFFHINNIAIRGGYLDHSNTQSTNSYLSFLLNFDEQISLSFKDFEYRRDDSMLKINGDLFGQLSRSFSGQLSFLHDNQLSTIALDIAEESYRFSINLYSFQWLNLIPAFSDSPIKDLEFQINALGELQNDQSIVSGSFNSKSLFFRSISIKPNQGSFYYQSRKNIGTLKLTEFLNPFVDEEHPIQINLQKKSIEAPRFILSPEIFEIKKFKVSNLIVENFFISFDSIIPKYSGFIKDLDLNDLYFDEIKNLSGNFSGNGNHMKFLVDSDASILKNHKKDFIPVAILGAGNVSGLAFDFNARILNQSSQIDLSLQIDSELLNPLSLELKGSDISKNLITFSLQKSLNGVSSYIDRSIDLLGKNSVYFNYSTNSSNLNPNLKVKISSNESKLTTDEDLIIDFSEPIIEGDSKNLYVFSPSGKVANFSFAGAYGLLNYKNAKINFYSLHDISSIELKSALDLERVSIKPPDIKAENKGEIQLSSLNLSNAISLKTKNFSLPMTESYKINFENSSMFIVNLDKVYGLLPSSFMKDKISIFLSGNGLTETYDLTLSTNINLDLEQFIENSIYLQVSGNELFKIDLNIKKNSPLMLKMYSDLKHVELDSPLNSLSKNKLVRLPTEILISNFSNPSIKLRNQKIDMHIRDVNNYDGYISIGKKIPDHFLKSFMQEPGLNIYFYSEVVNEDLLSSVFSGNSKSVSVKLNKLAFDAANFKFFNNNFFNVSGLFDLNGSEISGNLTGDKLNLNLRIDQTGFIRLEMKDSAISNTKFINSTQSPLDGPLNSRLIVSNSSFGKIKIKDLDVYLLNNKNNFTANNIKLNSNLISIKPLKNSSAAYFSIDKMQPLYKLRGEYLIKDSNKIPYLGDFADFSYFNGSINLQWRELSKLSHIEGGSTFIMKDLVIQDSFSNSLAFNLLGVLNLRNILSKLANLDLSIDEFTSTQLGRVEGDLLFSKSRLRLASPLYIETNAAKMKWVGQINKDSNNILEGLDLNLDLRIRFGENLPWYAAILGGLPAVAGSAVLNEVFKEDINNLTNYQYEILGTVSDPIFGTVK